MMLRGGIVMVSSSGGRGQWVTRIRNAGKQVLTQFICNYATGTGPVCELHTLYVCFGRECERDVTERGV